MTAPRALLFAAAAAAAVAARSAVTDAPPAVRVPTALPILRILPLGDSITFGCGSDAAPPDWYACCTATSGGYRAPLWGILNSSAVNASALFVGTESNGPGWVPEEQRAHEGHPGWTINQVGALGPREDGSRESPSSLTSPSLLTSPALPRRPDCVSATQVDGAAARHCPRQGGHERRGPGALQRLYGL